jgi:hypothetical protein
MRVLGLECAYTIHDAYGSINLVLGNGQSHGYNTTLIGAQYCINMASRALQRHGGLNA